MALDIIYWPVALTPLSPQKKNVSAPIPNNVMEETPDSGPGLKRKYKDILMQPVSGLFYFSWDDIDVLRRFAELAGYRSFYAPFIGRGSAEFTKNLWWYCRFQSESQDSIATPQSLGGQRWASVELGFEYWKGMPGVAIPDGAKTCR